jgi:NAD(P)-dependent dehydrogenase (short-subunit alcohol dehydrogenase family)
MKIEGKVAVVTGAASGIDEAVARELARRQVKSLFAIDRSPGVVQVARMIPPPGLRGTPWRSRWTRKVARQ